MYNNKIAILLSTYNGEFYLEEQINSIINQDYLNWELFIRDDGSKDSTVEIIKRYSKEYDNINYIEDDCRRGAAQSYMFLLSAIDADYYMFCDQDDIWCTNKIRVVYNIIRENRDKDIPILVFSNATVVDENLKKIDDSFWNYNKTPPTLLLSQPKYISVFNCALGCSMIFNKELKKCLDDYGANIMMHDWYVMIKALDNGLIFYTEQPLMLYRQHNNNAIGATKISFYSYFFKILNIPKVIKNQIKLYQFVNKYTHIGFFVFYILKFKFNILRLKK